MNYLPQKQRQNWLDALRGITMLLVIYSHVVNFTFGFSSIEEKESIINLFFVSFRMPMFFFVSGFIAFKVVEFWNLGNFKRRLWKKAQVQLIPTFFFFLLLIAFKSNDFHWSFPGGYWFTLVLFEFFLIYYTTSLIANYTKSWVRPILLWSLAGFLILLKRHIEGLAIPSYFALVELCEYFIFFVFGLSIRANWEKTVHILNKKGTIAILILFVISVFFIEQSGNSIHNLFLPILSRLKRFALVIILFNIFYQNKSYWNQNNLISTSLVFIGRRTLDLYMIHYFFIRPSVPLLSDLLRNCDNIVFELLIGSIFTITIALLSLSISTILRSSPLLAKYLFGASTTVKYHQ